MLFLPIIIVRQTFSIMLLHISVSFKLRNSNLTGNSLTTVSLIKYVTFLYVYAICLCLAHVFVICCLALLYVTRISEVQNRIFTSSRALQKTHSGRGTTFSPRNRNLIFDFKIGLRTQFRHRLCKIYHKITKIEQKYITHNTPIGYIFLVNKFP